jgi:hypothetical protein
MCLARGLIDAGTSARLNGCQPAPRMQRKLVRRRAQRRRMHDTTSSHVANALHDGAIAPRTASHDGAVAPHTLFILPAFEPVQLSILVLADGNRRAHGGRGYAGGARRVVSMAEHLARRPDVGTMVACILSPDNIAKRGDGFFLELYKEFIQLGVDIEARGALVSSNVRMEIHGDLGSLRARGGHAVSLADAILAVVEATKRVANPDLRLILGVGYGRDTARELDVDVILRTGMEEPGVLRLSGLRTSQRIANCAVTTLWPDVEPGEVDEVIDLCKRHTSPRFADGHGVAAIVELVEALATADLDAPVRAVITTSAPTAAVATALDRLFAGPLRGCATIAVEHAWREGHPPRRHGPAHGASRLLRIVRGSSPAGEDAEAEILSVLAPGQRPPLFTLPDGLPLGNANVHACEATAEGVVAGIRAALRFSAAHPPLCGRDRGPCRAAAPRVSEAPLRRPGASDRDAVGDRFVARTLGWAETAGLLVDGAAFRRAAVNYALTGFFIHFQVPTEWDEAGALWEQRADLTARYMHLVAAGDEGIFDRVLEGETSEQRWARLEVSSRFLQGALRAERSRPRVPRVPGAALLATLADQWRRLLDPYRGACLPAVEASFRAGLESLYVASLAEHRAGVTSDLFSGHCKERGTKERVIEAIEKRFAAAPPCIAARARALAVEATGARHSAAVNELRVLLYLTEAGSAIGAGLLFRTAALAAPARHVTTEGVAALDAAATLLDYHVRLSNDLSGFLESPTGDRDPKVNACTLLVPGSASGPARAAAVVQALVTCRRLLSWLGGELPCHLERVATAWPSMGVILRRGVFVGRRVYEVGHYTTASRADMSAIFDEAEARR